MTPRQEIILSIVSSPQFMFFCICIGASTGMWLADWMMEVQDRRERRERRERWQKLYDNGGREALRSLYPTESALTLMLRHDLD